jgi:hypothetical protein
MGLAVFAANRFPQAQLFRGLLFISIRSTNFRWLPKSNKAMMILKTESMI